MSENPKQSPQPIPSPMPTQLSNQDLSQSSTHGPNLNVRVSGPGAPMDPRNRRMRRMSEKMKAKESPPPNPNSKLLHQRLSGVERDLHRLAEVSDQNTHVFSDSLRMLESMGIVMQRVMNDVAAGTVRRVDERIDFQSYIQEYQLCLVMAGFAQWCGTLQPQEETIIKATTQDVVVFGGG